MHYNRALLQQAKPQYGYFTAQQAQQAGYSKSLQGYHARNGNWLRVDRGLFRLPGYQTSPESDFACWSLWAMGQCPERIVAVSHASALHYFGLCPLPPIQVMLTVSELRNNTKNPCCCLHLGTLAPDEVQMRNGFLITTPLRTLQDMRPDLSLSAHWGETVAAAQERGLITTEDCIRLADSGGGGRPQPERSAAAADGIRGMERAEGGMLVRDSADRGLAGALRREAWTVRMTGRSPTGGMRTVQRSFTLVEMLVVISIISILAALLLPSLTKALDTSRSMSCINNLRQVGMQVTAYADDHNQELPRQFWWSSSAAPAALSRSTSPAQPNALGYLTFYGYLGEAVTQPTIGNKPSELRCPAEAAPYFEYNSGKNWTSYVYQSNQDSSGASKSVNTTRTLKSTTCLAFDTNQFATPTNPAHARVYTNCLYADNRALTRPANFNTPSWGIWPKDFSGQ